MNPNNTRSSIEHKEARDQEYNFFVDKNMIESNYLKNFPRKSKIFTNLFEDAEHKYWIFQGNTSYWLAGLNPQCSLVDMNLPLLPMGSLLSQIELIAELIFGQKHNNNTNIPDIKKAIEDVEIFLVTKEDEGDKHLVRNLFKNGVDTLQEIPHSLSLNERVGFDALGMYIQETGSIYLWVDKIYGFAYNQLLFQSVLLHEVFHLIFDVMRKDLVLKKSTEINEETIDNCLVLYCYHNAFSQFKDDAKNAFLQIRGFVNSQSCKYAAAVPMFDEMKSWRDMRSKLIAFFYNN